MSDQITEYICAQMIKRSIATGHADTAQQAAGELLAAYDQMRAKWQQAEAELARVRGVVGTLPHDISCKRIDHIDPKWARPCDCWQRLIDGPQEAGSDE